MRWVQCTRERYSRRPALTSHWALRRRPASEAQYFVYAAGGRALHTLAQERAALQRCDPQCHTVRGAENYRCLDLQLPASSGFEA